MQPDVHLGQNRQPPKWINVDGLLKIETKSDQIWLIPWHHNKNNLLLGANLQWSLAASY